MAAPHRSIDKQAIRAHARTLEINWTPFAILIGAYLGLVISAASLPMAQVTAIASTNFPFLPEGCLTGGWGDRVIAARVAAGTLGAALSALVVILAIRPSFRQVEHPMPGMTWKPVPFMAMTLCLPLTLGAVGRGMRSDPCSVMTSPLDLAWRVIAIVCVLFFAYVGLKSYRRL